MTRTCQPGHDSAAASDVTQLLIAFCCAHVRLNIKLNKKSTEPPLLVMSRIIQCFFFFPLAYSNANHINYRKPLRTVCTSKLHRCIQISVLLHESTFIKQ